MSWDEGWQVETHSAHETQNLARQLGHTMRPGAVVALVGDLGAGKTTFVQGFASAVGAPDLSQVLSPTYTLVNEYPAGDMTLIHMDFYRIQTSHAAHALGIEEYFERRDTICVIEWADMHPELLPEHTVWVRLQNRSAAGRLCTVIGWQPLDAPPMGRDL